MIMMLSFEQLHGTELEPSAAVDAECIALIETLRQGFPPDRNAVPDQIKCRCVNHCTKLTAYRSAATKCLRAEVTEALHGAHQGVNGMLNNARERFWMHRSGYVKHSAVFVTRSLPLKHANR